MTLLFLHAQQHTSVDGRPVRASNSVSSGAMAAAIVGLLSMSVILMCYKYGPRVKDNVMRWFTSGDLTQNELWTQQSAAIRAAVLALPVVSFTRPCGEAEEEDECSM